MKKTITFIITATLILGLTACVAQEESPSRERERAPETLDTSAERTEFTPPTAIAHSSEDDRWCHCGEHYVDEDLRRLAPPLHIHEMWSGFVGEFLTDVENIYEATLIQWDTEHPDSLVIRTDEPLRNVMFVSLGHDFSDLENEIFFYTEEIIYTVDELLPGDALLLNVAFAHYLIPRGGLIFTDESGEQKSMIISESMRGGCFPRYELSSHKVEFRG
jgi:hypothetical protein